MPGSVLDTTADSSATLIPADLPKAGEAHLWRIDLQVDADELTRCRGLLTEQELQRASRFRFDRHRRRFTVRRAQLRRLLALYLGIEPRAVSFQTGQREKPYLAAHLTRDQQEPLQFNLSDCKDVAFVGVKVGLELGVDVEIVRPMPDALSISRSFFAQEEQEVLAAASQAETHATFFRCWTRKEAYIKAIGKGLAVPLDSFTVSMGRHEPARFLGFRGLPGEERHWTLKHVEPEPHIFVAVAARQPDLSIQCFTAPPFPSEPPSVSLPPMETW